MPDSRRKTFDWLFWLAALCVVATYIRVIWFTPPERLQGYAQKIFYIHLPAALCGFLAFGIVAICGILYLWLRDPRLDRMAASSAEVGVIFITVVLVTGPLWGKPIWGTYWTWDARLTSTLFLWLIFLGYLLMRGAIEDRDMRARYSAVLGILGALLIPFIHLSVYMFRTLHPKPIILKPSAPSAPGDMLLTMSISFVSFVLLYFGLVRARYRLAAERDALALARAEAEAGA